MFFKKAPKRIAGLRQVFIAGFSPRIEIFYDVKTKRIDSKLMMEEKSEPKRNR
jgi:hypothetical protein